MALPTAGIALCAGGLGLELGLRLAVPGYRTFCHVERDSYAAALIVARMEDQAVEQAPVWDDLITFDGLPWRGRVDCITAGFPCQPASVAGRRQGTDDERWLWPDVARIIREVQPRWVFLENVPGLLTVNRGRAAEEIFGALAEEGFDVAWDVFSAAEAGAPHLRERLFILAYNSGTGPRRALSVGKGRQGWTRLDFGSHVLAHAASSGHSPFPAESEPNGAGALSPPSRAYVGDARGRGYDWRAHEPGREPSGRAAAEGAGEAVGDTKRPRRQASGQRRCQHARSQSEAGCRAMEHPKDIGYSEPKGARQRLTRPANSGPVVGNAGGAELEDGRPVSITGAQPSPWPPGPAERDAWAAALRERPDLAPALPQSEIRRGPDGLAGGMGGHRTDQLRVLGNGVVPIVAALAFVALQHALAGEG